MLEKVRLALRLQTVVFDAELLGLIAAAIRDIKHAGPEFPVTENKVDGTVVDYIVTDELASMAIITYCRMHFGSPEDYDRLKASYDEQKGQMRESSAYGMTEVE